MFQFGADYGSYPPPVQHEPIYVLYVFIIFQVRDSLKTITILKNPKTPLVKKRQLMSITFGDYRTKMRKEEKTLRFGKTIDIQRI